MPRYEVFVPAAPPALPMDVTLRIEAEHWLAALKSGLQKIGGAQMTSNVLCDIQDDGSIHVTDSTSGRVFRIQEMAAVPAPAAAPPAPPPAAASPPAPRAAAPAPRPPPPAAPPPAAAPPAARPAPPPPATAKPAPPPAAAPQASRPAPPPAAAAKPAPPPAAKPPAPPPAPAAAPAPAARAAPAAPAARPRPSSEPSAVEQVAKPSQPPPARIGRTHREAREDLLAELFEAVSRLQGQRDRKAGLGFLLDLAMEKLQCESGTVFLSALADDDLEFAVVRGPRATELSTAKMTVPVGVGIVGFCAQENVCLAVSDAQKDKRFHRAISDAIGYETRSLLCAPVAREGRVLGAIEVMNKAGGAVFGEGDLAVLAYLAAQAAEFLHRLDVR